MQNDILCFSSIIWSVWTDRKNIHKTNEDCQEKYDILEWIIIVIPQVVKAWKYIDLEKAITFS